MPQLATAQAASSYLEKLRSKVPMLYERDNVLFAKIAKSADVEIVSPRNMRISLQVRPGGRAGQTNLDGGDMGRGTGSQRIEVNLTPQQFRIAVEVTKLVELATNKPSKAVENVAKSEFKNGMAQFRAFLDKMMQTDGTGTVGTVSVVAGGGATLTLAAPYDVRLIYIGQLLCVFAAGFGTIRGLVEVLTVDYDNKLITVQQPTNCPSSPGAATLANIIVGDVLTCEGPTTTGTPTSLFGLKYHQSNASSGTWMNQNRANYPELRTPTVTANSQLVTGHVRAAKNRIRKVLGTEAFKGAKFIAYMGMEQEHAWEQLGITISEIVRSGNSQTQPDMLFGQSGTMGGAPIETSINADPTRIDFLALSNFVRAITQDIDYLDIGGQTIFQTYGASGGVNAAYVFYFITMFQLAAQNPRLGAYISSLSVPNYY